jgi:hypothetical protein
MLHFFPRPGGGSDRRDKNATNSSASRPQTVDHREALRADCARCQGLCCVGLAFDQSEWFGFDKPANVACQHLQPDCTCSIHGELGARGQAGCAVYDCYGAGQRITQELYAGVSWQREPKAHATLFEAFRRLKRVHELRLLLHEAERLPLLPLQTTALEQLLTRLEPASGFSAQTLDALDLNDLEVAAHTWLRGLSGNVADRARRRLSLARG